MTTELHDAVRTLIRHAGGDPDDPDLRDTPARYLLALAEMTSGRHADLGDILSAQFEAGGCDIVEAKGIRFSSISDEISLSSEVADITHTFRGRRPRSFPFIKAPTPIPPSVRALYSFPL